MTTHYKTPRCPHCDAKALLVTGLDVYPHRPDLGDKRFWQCKPCDAYVGCHVDGAFMVDEHGKRHHSDGTLPLGTLANKELRALRLAAHNLVDPLWQGIPGRRRKVYAWLAEQLRIPVHECHIAYFDSARCEQVVDLLLERDDPSEAELEQACQPKAPPSAMAQAFAALRQVPAA